MARLSPATFIREVRKEASKIVWPTRKETISSTIMVFLMVAFMSVFFLVVDQFFSWGIRFILG